MDNASITGLMTWANHHSFSILSLNSSARECVSFTSLIMNSNLVMPFCTYLGHF